MVCFFLMAMTISGYTASFFSLSINFSGQIISISALPFWAAMGQLVSIGIVYLSSGLSDSSFQLLTIFAIDSFFIIIFVIIFWIFIRKTLPTSEGLAESQPFYSLPQAGFGPEFRKDLKNHFFWGFFFALLLFAVCFNASIFYMDLRIDTWPGFFNSVMNDGLFQYEKNIDFAAQIHIYQQIVQLAASILFFALQFCCIRYLLREIPFSRSEDYDMTKATEEFKFHVDKRMSKLYRAQWLTSLAAWIGLMITCGCLVSIRFQSKTSFGLLFALTGFGRTLIYSGRELQRSSMHMVRSQEDYAYTEALVKQYDFFDSFIQTGFYSTLLALGQILTILTMEFLPLYFPFVIFLLGSSLYIVHWLLCCLMSYFSRCRCL